MKSFLITLAGIALFFSTLALSSCVEPGTTEIKLTGAETTLPPELKGLKIYRVVTEGHTVYVGSLNGQPATSTTYPSGKFQESLILVNEDAPRRITYQRIISENDSILVIQK